MFKLVINQLDKIFITSDAATVVKEMEVVHPAAKLIVEAAQKQEEQAVQLKTKSAVFFFYDFPVQILRGEGDGTVENPGVDILKGHSALMGMNQCVQSLRNKGLGIGKSNPFQILFCLFF